LVSYIESLKKFQHSASTNSAVEKARAFFRSLELKHLGSSSSNSEHSSSSRRRTTTNNNNTHLPSSKVSQPSSISSSSSSSIIDDSHNTISTTTTTNDSLFNNNKNPSNCIATARIIRVINPNYSNPRDMIVHRVINNQQDDHQLASSYFNFQKVLSQKNLQAPKQYFNERSQSYSISFDKHRDIQPHYGKIFAEKKSIIMEKKRDTITINVS
jgi:hypothetical protein